MRALSILCLATAPLLIAATAADRWVEIDDPDEEVTVMYDPVTLRREGDMVTVWALFDFAAEESAWQEARIQYQFDCRRRLSRNLFSVTYDAAGKQTDQTGRKNAPFKPVVPDTTGESIMTEVCTPGGAPRAQPEVVA